MNINEISLKELDPESFASRVAVDQKRLEERKSCIICRKRRIDIDKRPLYNSCYLEIIKDFPEKYFPKNNFYLTFCKEFDRIYQKYDKIEGF